MASRERNYRKVSRRISKKESRRRTALRPRQQRTLRQIRAKLIEACAIYHGACAHS
jgi:hypothetical protein